MSILFLDEADVAAALDVTGADVFQIFRPRGQTQIFFDVVLGNVIASHRAENQIAILDDCFLFTFNEATERVRIVGDESKEPVNQDNYDTAAEGREKCSAAIDRARERRSEDNDQNGIKRGLARERTFMSDPNHGQRGDEDDDPAK